jgi:hypothetical protein
MERKMTKFAAVQISYKHGSNLDAFERLTSKELKKIFKCKKIVELKQCKKSDTKLSEFGDIADYKLNQLRRTLTSINLDDMTENRFRNEKETKTFILSDDASVSGLAFDALENNFAIKLFQLNDKEVTNFINSIEIIQSEDKLVSSLSAAKEFCETLNAIESDMGLTLLHDGAIDEIEEKIFDIANDVETSRQVLAEIFEARWF